MEDGDLEMMFTFMRWPPPCTTGVLRTSYPGPVASPFLECPRDDCDWTAAGCATDLASQSAQPQRLLGLNRNMRLRHWARALGAISQYKGGFYYLKDRYSDLNGLSLGKDGYSGRWSGLSFRLQTIQAVRYQNTVPSEPDVRGGQKPLRVDGLGIRART